MLLASTKSPDRERYELGEFIAGVDALEVDRRASAEAMREHASFIQVLQAALDKEAAQFLKADAKRQDLEATNPEKAKEMADDMSTKVLMDQILLKMKNLREELAKASSMRDAVGATVGHAALRAHRALPARDDRHAGARHSAADVRHRPHAVPVAQPAAARPLCAPRRPRVHGMALEPGRQNEGEGPVGRSARTVHIFT